MKSIATEQARPGQILGRQILSGDGVLLAGQGEAITENLLQVLKRLKIENIVIADSERKKVLLVDDNMTNLTTGKDMLKDQYKVYPVPSAEIMFDLLGNIIPDLILLDIEMPVMNGYEAIKRLKSKPDWAEIPVIFLTSKTDEGSELEGLSLGAIDYVAKPFSAPLLLKRIENHLFSAMQKKQLKAFNTSLEEMVHQKTAEVFNLQNAVLGTVADLVEFRDDVTGGHITRTQKYLEILLDKLVEEKIYADEVSGWDMEHLLPSAQLHDVGKIGISDMILNKPGKLTPEEFKIMQGHVAIGVEAIKKIEQKTTEHAFLRHAGRIAGTHHEKWDGSGYPDGLSGENIPLEGRLMAIADVYDALISVRPYKRPFSADEARQIIEDGKGTHFDPVLVDVFSKVANKFAEVAKKEQGVQ
ncbi:MAG: response regulator [Desulfovibrio sp.]|jgi:putative two-component system response regulator|nr:response regulator [Desulfovibrio sp.]